MLRVKRLAILALPCLLLLACAGSEPAVTVAPAVAAAAIPASATSQGQPATLGVPVGTADNLDITVLSLSADPAGVGRNLSMATPEAGDRFFAVRVRVVNRAESADPRQISWTGYSLVTSARQILTPAANFQTPNARWLLAKLLPDGQAEGHLLFRLPNGEEPHLLLYTVKGQPDTYFALK